MRATFDWQYGAGAQAIAKLPIIKIKGARSSPRSLKSID
jgi:hypothetical protein